MYIKFYSQYFYWCLKGFIKTCILKVHVRYDLQKVLQNKRKNAMLFITVSKLDFFYL